MRTAVTFARLHGEDTFQVLTGQEVSVNQQISEAKGLGFAGREHPDYAEVQVWISDSGLAKKLRFNEPAPVAGGEEISESTSDPTTKKKKD